MTMPVGLWYRRTAVEFFCTFCPPAPEERKTSISMSESGMSISTSSTSAITATVAVEVWMRPELRWLARAGRGARRIRT